MWAEIFYSANRQILIVQIDILIKIAIKANNQYYNHHYEKSF